MITKRDAVGAEVRKLRKAKGVTGSELAEKMGCSQSLISKVERGKIRPSEEFISDFVLALKLPKTDSIRLQGMTSAFLLEMTGWGVGDRTYESKQEAIGEIELASKEKRTFSTMVVAGLLQTESYVQHLFRGFNPKMPQAEINKAVKGRLKRQSVLDSPGKTIKLINSEAAFGCWFCPPAVMADQCERILDLMSTHDFEYRILPLNKVISTCYLDTFTIYDRIRVDVETLTMNTIHWQQTEIDYYEEHFARLMNDSVSGKAARKILERHLKLARSAS